MTDETKEGFRFPQYCPRGRTDCNALSQIISTGHGSFICCGENDGQRRIKQDKYTFCLKSAENVDLMTFHDLRDLAHISAVVSFVVGIETPPVAPENSS